MANNLPIISRSKGIQRVHTRSIVTNRGRKDILVNPNVRKNIVNRQYGKNIVKTKENNNFDLKNKANLIKKEFPIKTRWQEVLKPQTGPTELDIKAKEQRKIEPILKTLRPGEIYAKKVKLNFPNNPMSVSGSISIIDNVGDSHNYFMEFRMSSANLIEWLLEKQENKEPVIIQTGDSGFMDNVILSAREPEELTAADRIPIYDRGTMYSYQQRNDGGLNIVEFGGSGIVKLKPGLDLNDYENEMYKKGKDVFGRRISPQTNLDEFKKIDIKEPIVVKRIFSNNKNLREGIIIKDDFGYFVGFTNFADTFIPEISKEFDNLKEAKKYMKYIEENYNG